MLAKPIEAISAEDIDSLVANEVKEGLTLDYKRDLVADTKDDKREFLADIASFANGRGGDIVFGLGDRRDGNGQSTGVPEFVGVSVANEDELKKRMQSWIDSGIEPQVPNVRMRLVECESGNVFIVRIPKSWAAPHMVKFQVRPAFYARNNVGKYPLGMNEIRALFTDQVGLTESIRNFRNYRIAQIEASETPIALEKGPKIVMHMLPVSSFLGGASAFDLGSMSKNHDLIRPLYWDLHNYRINIDGFLSYSNDGGNGSVNSYAQFFRDGKIEYVESGLLAPGENPAHGIPYLCSESEMMKTVTQSLNLYKKAQVVPPVVIYVALLNVKGLTINPGRNYFVRRTHPIDREMLMLPEVVANDFDVAVDELIKPVLDAIWNACGYAECFCYKEGKWVGTRD